MNATGYIIEPSWFYWLSVIDNLRLAIEAGLFIVGMGLVALIIFGVFEENHDNLRKWFKIGGIALIPLVILAVFIPNQETLITMMVAKYATYENVGLTVDALQSAVDYIIQSIQSLR